MDNAGKQTQLDAKLSQVKQLVQDAKRAPMLKKADKAESALDAATDLISDIVDTVKKLGGLTINLNRRVEAIERKGEIANAD